MPIFNGGGQQSTIGGMLRQAQQPQPQAPDPQMLDNKAAYQDVLRKWYGTRPKFGTPNWRAQYQAWRGAKPTGKDVGVLQPTLAGVLQQLMRR